MNLPTEEQIDQLQALLDAGTQGEWASTRRSIRCNGKWIGEIAPDGSAALVVELHNLAPDLLEAARENLRLREALQEALGALKCHTGESTLITQQKAEKALGKETA